MSDEQRIALKGVILSWLFDVAHPVGLYNIRVKDKNALTNKYCDGISQIREASTARDDEIGWNTILECFIESLNISPEIKLKSNKTPNDFEDNLNTIFKSIGLPNGIEDVLEASLNRNPEAKRLIKKAMDNADSVKGSRTWRNEDPKQSTYMKEQKDRVSRSILGSDAERNILTFQVSELPDNLCSKELKSRLNRKFSFVYELLSVDFDELKHLLCDSDNVPTKFLIELELFFRNQNIDFLEHLPSSSKYEDEIARKVIIDSVTVIMTQIANIKEK